jgi:uncharacterized protein (UPF0276 family)
MQTSGVTSTKIWAETPRPLGLGVGLDLPWGVRAGFERTASGGRVTPKVRRFFDRYRDLFSYAFLAYQPNGRNSLDVRDYVAAYDDYFEAVGHGKGRALHQTTLNLGAVEPYDRAAICEFTNSMTERYGLRWIVEDLGIWSMNGRVMPYPLPPLLTEAGLAACVRNVRDASAQLDAPLSVEFPGFTEGTNFFVGRMDAFEFFARLADQTGVTVTIDVGHILSYQWLRGRTGSRMIEDLRSLPLDRCFEMHLSGCSIVGGKFRDAHHGVLLDEQITLLEELLALCPNLRAVTYEDPQFDEDGLLIPKSVRNFERLVDMVQVWTAG